MKNKSFIVIVLCSLIFLLASSVAYAYPVFTLFDDNDLEYKNVENWVDVDSSNDINTGDYFYGIMKVQVISAGGSDTWASNDITSPYDSFSGYFCTEVVSTTWTSPGLYTIDLGPMATDPYGILNQGGITGEVMMLFTDTVTKYTEDGPTVQDDIDDATDGTLWASFTTDSGYWYTPNAPIVPPGAGNKVGDSLGGLNFVQDNTGIPEWEKINDPIEGVVNLDVQMYFQSEIEDHGAAGVHGNGLWQFKSNDPATMHPTPEPATMLLLGTGLIGLAGFARKKKFFKKD